MPSRNYYPPLVIDFKKASIKELISIVQLLKYSTSLVNEDIINLSNELIRRLECKLEVNTDTIQLIQLLLILLKGIPNTHININILKSFIKGKPHISHFPLVNERHIPPKIMKKQKVPIIKR